VAAYILKPEIVSKLFTTIAPWYTDRNGGYTRIVRIGHRLGDAGETAYLELVKTDEQKEQDRAARQAAAEAKALAQSGEKPEKKKKKTEAEAEAAAAEEKPKRGKKKEAAGAGAGGGGAKRRGGPRKVGGG
jgi:large subunit ribosomal protein L17